MQALVPAFLRHCKVTTFVADALTMADDALRFMDIFHHPSSIIHLPSSILHLTSYIIHLPSSILRFPQLFDDGTHLSGRERLAGSFVARRLQLLPKLGATVNPAHQVTHSRPWAAVREVHQGQFLLGVCPNFQFTIHNTYYFTFLPFYLLHNTR